MNFFPVWYQIWSGGSWMTASATTHNLFGGRKRVLVRSGNGPDGWSVLKEE